MAHSGCPSSADEAAGDAEWAAARLDSIQGEKVTTGLFYDEDGTEQTFVSGEDGDASNAVDLLGEVDAPASPLGTYPSASHVEVKVAAAMRDSDSRFGVLVINNVNGPCRGVFGCTSAVPRLLPEGAALVVWWSDGGEMRSQRFTGGSG